MLWVLKANIYKYKRDIQSLTSLTSSKLTTFSVLRFLSKLKYGTRLREYILKFHVCTRCVSVIYHEFFKKTTLRNKEHSSLNSNNY